MAKKHFSAHSISLYMFPLVALVIIVTNMFSNDPLINRMIAVVLLMAGWWISEAVPIAVTSVLPVVLFPLLGVMDGGTASEEYFNDIIFLFMGGFILSLALEKWNLHLKIAFKTLMLFGSKPYRILLGFMFTSSFLSMWMSNTATAVLMLPIALSVIKEMETIYGKEAMKRFKVGLLVGIAYACSIGGITTLIGTPPNLAFAAIFKSMYPHAAEITFSTWFVFGLPIYIILLASSSFIVYRLFPAKFSNGDSFRKYISKQNDDLGKVNYEQKRILVLFTLFALLLIFKNDLTIGSFHLPGWSDLFPFKSYIKDGTIAMLIAVMLFVIPSSSARGKKLMDWSTAVKLPWGIILLFGGGFALARGSVDSGLTQWIGESLAKYSHAPLPVFIGINATFMTFITTFTSNVSTAQILLPAAGALSQSIHLDPRILMISMTFASSFAFILPIATPPNAIVFGSGQIKMKDMVIPGLILSVIGIITLIVIMYLWGFEIFHIKPSVYPAWAINQ